MGKVHGSPKQGWADNFLVVSDSSVGKHPDSLFTYFDGGKPLKQGLMGGNHVSTLFLYGEVISWAIWLQSA